VSRKSLDQVAGVFRMTRLLENTLHQFATLTACIGLLLPIEHTARTVPGRPQERPTGQLSDLTVRRLDGTKVRRDTQQRPTVYLVFSPNCAVAHAITSAWRALQADPALRAWDFVGLAWDDDSPNAVHEFRVRHQLNVSDVFLVAFDEFRKATGVVMTPAIVAVDSSGRIRLVAQGWFEAGGDRHDELVRHLSRLVGPGD